MSRNTAHNVTRTHHVVSIQQAALGSPTLANLVQLAEESAQRLKSIAPLLPPALRTSVAAGPIHGTEWCLLVNGNAAAAKLRQLSPVLRAHLNERGWEVTSIRLKIQITARLA
ncbi:MAG: hypothetical protein RLZZ401_339 [Pseudomonadota bacterium]|jgi:hypothetical protein